MVELSGFWMPSDEIFDCRRAWLASRGIIGHWQPSFNWRPSQAASQKKRIYSKSHDFLEAGVFSLMSRPSLSAGTASTMTIYSILWIQSVSSQDKWTFISWVNSIPKPLLHQPGRLFGQISFVCAFYRDSPCLWWSERRLHEKTGPMLYTWKRLALKSTPRLRFCWLSLRRVARRIQAWGLVATLTAGSRTRAQPDPES